MTSTRFNVGLNSDTRNSSKVLKPPGGGSSDIFGASGDQPVEPQRKIRNHLTSSIFGDETITPSRNKAGKDTFNNLFGNEHQVRPSSTFSGKMKSNISDDVTSIDAKKVLIFTDDITLPTDQLATNVSVPETAVSSEPDGTLETNGVDTPVGQEPSRTIATPSNSGWMRGVSTRRPDGNPVTGDGYNAETPAVNGSSSSAASTPAPTPSAPAPTPSAGKQRVPPGGFSSGLW